MRRISLPTLPCRIASGLLLARRASSARGSRRKRACDLDETAVDVRQIAGQRGERTVIAGERKQGFGGVAVTQRSAAPQSGLPSCPRRNATRMLSSTLMSPNSCVV